MAIEDNNYDYLDELLEGYNKQEKYMTTYDIMLGVKARGALRHAEPYLSREDFLKYSKELNDAMANCNINAIRKLEEKLSAVVVGKPIRPAFHEQSSDNRTLDPNKKRKLPLYSQTKKKILVKRVKLAATTVLCAILVAGAVICSCIIRDKEKDNATDIPKDKYSQSSESEEDKFEEVSLIDLDLEYSSGTTLTSDSVKELSSAVVNDLNELYMLVGGDAELPQVVTDSRLASISFFENSCNTHDTTGDYAGMMQMSESAVIDSLAKIEKLYNKIVNKMNTISDSEKAIYQEKLNNNYYVQNVIGKSAEDLWEECKTDGKLCMALSAGALASISDNNWTALNGNTNLIVLSYNAGIGNLLNKFVPAGIVNISSDKKDVTIDVSNVYKLSPELQEKFWEALNYLAKVQGGAKILNQNPNADIATILDSFRIQVGSKGEQNITQYNYMPSGTHAIGMEQGLDR